MVWSWSTPSPSHAHPIPTQPLLNPYSILTWMKRALRSPQRPARRACGSKVGDLFFGVSQGSIQNLVTPWATLVPTPTAFKIRDDSRTPVPAGRGFAADRFAFAVGLFFPLTCGL